ncbi:MAG: MBL fold metallo-hydrolase [Chloroflexota bacterium]
MRPIHDAELPSYAGDMGPSDDIVELARGAELLILEATLDTNEFDDLKRGHLTAEEAVDHALRAGVPRTILVHYPIERLEAIRAICAPTDGRVLPALPRMEIEVVAGGEPIVILPDRRS